MIGIDPVPRACLDSANRPVLVLNGGQDNGDDAAAELAAIIPGAVAAVAGDGNHGTAPGDPAFHAALTEFLARTGPA